MNHPDPLDLLSHVFETPAGTESAVALHIRSCTDCAAEVRRMAGMGALLRSTRAAQAPTPECLDDDTVAALAGGTLDGASRAVVLPHLASCPRCRGAVASLARMLGDPAVGREVAAVGRTARWRSYRVALPAAAAALVLLLAWPPRANDNASLHRAPTITASAAPLPMSPVGAVAVAEILRWASVAGADRYRVTLFDAQGGVLYETQLADTVAALPDSIFLVPGRSYLWKVEARTGWDRWATSELVEFSVAGGAFR